MAILCPRCLDLLEDLEPLEALGTVFVNAARLGHAECMRAAHRDGRLAPGDRTLDEALCAAARAGYAGAMAAIYDWGATPRGVGAALVSAADGGRPGCARLAHGWLVAAVDAGSLPEDAAVGYLRTATATAARHTRTTAAPYASRAA
jgi:hypothetical protein